MSVAEGELGDLIDRIYDATLDPPIWNDVAAGLEALLRGRVAFLVQEQRPMGFFRPCSQSGQDDVSEYLDHHWRTDMGMQRLRSAPVGACVADSRLVSDEARDRLGFYRDYLRPRGLHRGFYTVLSRDGARSMVMGVHRPDRNDDFSENCERAVERVRPHLSRGLALAHRLTATTAERNACFSALEQAGLGLIVVTRDGAVRFANSLGEAQLRDGALKTGAGRCEALGPADNRALQAAVAQAARPVDAASSTLTLTSRRGEPVRATVMPLRPGGSSDFSAEPLAMLIFGGAAPQLDDLQLRREYGLTASEARLLKALVSGERLSDYAARVGVQVTTAKTHLSAVFAKTGEQRQADLVRLALTDPALRVQLDRAA